MIPLYAAIDKETRAVVTLFVGGLPPTGEDAPADAFVLDDTHEVVDVTQRNYSLIEPGWVLHEDGTFMPPDVIDGGA